MSNLSTETFTNDRATTRHCISVSAATFKELREYAERNNITMGRAIGQLLANNADLT